MMIVKILDSESLTSDGRGGIPQFESALLAHPEATEIVVGSVAQKIIGRLFLHNNSPAVMLRFSENAQQECLAGGYIHPSSRAVIPIRMEPRFMPQVIYIIAPE